MAKFHSQNSFLRNAGTFGEFLDVNNLPEMPGIRSDIKELEEFKKSYPGVVILNHPTWKDHVSGDNDVNVTQELIESGLIDGVEILNGTILHNAASMRVSRSAINMFIEARKNGVNVAAIGASDAHVGINNPRMGNLVGSAVTEFCSTYADGVFDAIRNGGNNTLAIAVKDSVRKKVSSILKDQNNRQAHKFVRY